LPSLISQRFDPIFIETVDAERQSEIRLDHLVPQFENDTKGQLQILWLLGEDGQFEIKRSCESDMSRNKRSGALAFAAAGELRGCLRSEMIGRCDHDTFAHLFLVAPCLFRVVLRKFKSQA
jgi:hypothetical protein